ncbi:MAG TPA: DinB family protein [Vicinamibacteria bacterium]
MPDTPGSLDIDPAALLAGARAELARLPGLLHGLLDGLDLATWGARPAPGEWAPVEIVCHLRDEEVEDFGARVGAVLEARARVSPIDPERWAEERGYRRADPGAALAALCDARAASVTSLAAIAPARLRGVVELPGGGRLSGLDLLAAWVAHDRLHLAQLAGTLARLWAARWAPLRAGYAGPIPYPPGTPQ